MGLYPRPGSPYWWMYIEPTQQCKSTKVRREGISPEQTRQQEKNARIIYVQACNRAIAEKNGLAKPPRTFLAQLEWYERHELPTHRGAERERWTLELFRQAFPTQALSEITRDAVKEWATDRLASHAVSTVNREIDILKRIVASGVPKYIDASPLLEMKRLRPKRGQAPEEPAVLTREDQRTLIAATTTPLQRALIILAITTLYRMSDVLDLQWTHVRDTWIEARDTKNGQRVRVPLSPQAQEALKAIPMEGRTRYIFQRYRRDDPDKQRNVVRQMLNRLCRKAGIPYGRMHAGITFHSFRHTGTTRMVERGVDLRTVQEIGGWKNLRQLSRYAHPTDRARVDAVALIDNPSTLDGETDETPD